MRKTKKKRHPVRDTKEFKELAKELRKQVPDKKKHLQEMLDEIIVEATDKTEQKRQMPKKPSEMAPVVMSSQYRYIYR